MQVKKSLQFGTTTIEYHLVFAVQKTVAINIHPDQQITILAPEGSEPAAIEELL